MLLRIDPRSSISIHDQLTGQLRRAIDGGDPAPGEKLPPAKELAAGLDVNVHTILRAFKTLSEEGLLEIRRGRGTTVTNAAPALADLNELASRLVTHARRSGLTDPDIISLLEAHL